jgi:hypothetical protein
VTINPSPRLCVGQEVALDDHTEAVDGWSPSALLLERNDRRFAQSKGFRAVLKIRL